MRRIRAPWIVTVVIVVASALAGANRVAQAGVPSAITGGTSAITGGASWPSAGHDIHNTRFTADRQIPPGKASGLKVAWSITTGALSWGRSLSLTGPCTSATT